MKTNQSRTCTLAGIAVFALLALPGIAGAQVHADEMPLDDVAVACALTTGTYTVQGGDDGFSTPAGAGGTSVDLGNYPQVASLLGGTPSPSVVSLKGVPLHSSLGTIDTIVTRLCTVKMNQGGSRSTPIRINALHLRSESTVTAGGVEYALDLELAANRPSGDNGTMTLTMNSAVAGDGGSYSATLQVLPKLTFTPTGGGSPVVVDCGAVGCSAATISTSNSPWTRIDTAGGFNPGNHGVTPLPAGVTVSGGYTTAGRQGCVPGIKPIRPNYPPGPSDHMQAAAQKHHPQPPRDCVVTTGTPTGTATAAQNLALVASALPAYCTVVVANGRHFEVDNAQLIEIDAASGRPLNASASSLR